VGKAPSPERVPWILNQFDEGDEKSPLCVKEREGEEGVRHVYTTQCTLGWSIQRSAFIEQ
jgi:hypothetical protein